MATRRKNLPSSAIKAPFMVQTPTTAGSIASATTTGQLIASSALKEKSSISKENNNSGQRKPTELARIKEEPRLEACSTGT